MKKFLSCLGFLTIIKIPDRFLSRREELPDSLVYFPLVGIIIGVIISIFFTVCNYIFPLIMSMVLTLGLEILITGGIHVDGLADMFDGVFSGEKDKNKILQIMKKGDVGVFGILSLTFALTLKVGFSYFIFLGSKSLVLFLFVLVFMPAFGRWSMVYLIHKYPSAKENSLVNIFSGKNSRKSLVLSTIYLALFFILANIVSGIFRIFLNFDWYKIDRDIFCEVLFFVLISILIFLLILLFSIAIGKFFTQRVSGITGDILGGICVTTEIFYLLVSYIWLKFSG